MSSKNAFDKIKVASAASSVICEINAEQAAIIESQAHPGIVTRLFGDRMYERALALCHRGEQLDRCTVILFIATHCIGDMIYLDSKQVEAISCNWA